MLVVERIYFTAYSVRFVEDMAFAKRLGVSNFLEHFLMVMSKSLIKLVLIL